jgi:hypothetical protein
VVKSIQQDDLLKLKNQQGLKIMEFKEEHMTVSAIEKGDYDEPQCLMQDDTSTRWITRYIPKKTWIKFEFKEPMEIRHYLLRYGDNNRGNADPIEWTV